MIDCFGLNPADRVEDWIWDQIPLSGCPKSVAQGLWGGLNADGPDDALGPIGDGLLGCIPGYGLFKCSCKLVKGCTPVCCDEDQCAPGVAPPGEGGGGGSSICQVPCDTADLIDLAESLLAGTGGSEMEPLSDPLLENLRTQSERLKTFVRPVVEFFGAPIWIDFSVTGDREALAAWLVDFETFSLVASEDGHRIGPSEQALLALVPLPSMLDQSDVELFVERWNRTYDYLDLGIDSIFEVPEGQSTNFIPLVEWEQEIDAAIELDEILGDEGWEGLYDAFINAVVLVQNSLDDGEGICASVTIQIEQTVAITRQAFEASLTLNNGSETDPLEDVSVELFIRDESGMSAGERFFVFDPELDGLSAVDGTGTLGAGQSGSAVWTLLPGDSAAPISPQVYYIAGEVTYTYQGDTLVLPLFPVPITVVPNANLELRYFLERTVYGDDPFTPEIEPSLPFSLGLVMRNTGAGIAGDVRIETAQPEIVENEQGLAIDFELISTQVQDEEVSPSLDVAFGDILPEESRVARWLMISSLQGEFVSYDASVESVNGLDDPDFTIIDADPEVWPLVHVVRADDPSDDGIPDFLADTQPDLDDLPDRVYTSSGGIESVTATIDPTVIVDVPALTASVELPIDEGWQYVRLDDPFNGTLPLIGAIRDADGKSLQLGTNAWQTDRIDRSVDPGVVERFVHLFDRGGDGRYTLVFDVDSSDPEVTVWQSVRSHGPVAGDVSLLHPAGEPGSDSRAGGVDRLVLGFSEPVDATTIVPANVAIDGFDDRGAVVDLSSTVVSITPSLGDTWATITFAPPLPENARYCIQLIGVRDPAGNILDAGSGRLDLTTIPGDATGDRRVNNTDVGGVLTLLGTDPIDTSDVFQVRSDINTDGRIDFLDFDLVIAARGTNLRAIRNPCVFSPASGGGGIVRADPTGTSGPLAGPAAGGRPGAAAVAAGRANGSSDSGPANPPGPDPSEPQPKAGPRLAWVDAPWLGSGGRLPVDLERLAVSAGAGTASIDPRSVLEDFGVDPQAIEAWPDGSWAIGRLPERLATPDGHASLRAAMLRLGLRVSPVLLDQHGRPMLVEPVILARASAGVPADWLERVLETRFDGASTRFGPAGVRIGLAERDGTRVLAAAASLHARRDIHSAEPDLRLLVDRVEPGSVGVASDAAGAKAAAGAANAGGSDWPVDAVRVVIVGGSRSSELTPWTTAMDRLAPATRGLHEVSREPLGRPGRGGTVATRTGRIAAAIAAAAAHAEVVVLAGRPAMASPWIEAAVADAAAAGSVLVGPGLVTEAESFADPPLLTVVPLADALAGDSGETPWLVVQTGAATGGTRAVRAAARGEALAAASATIAAVAAIDPEVDPDGWLAIVSAARMQPSGASRGFGPRVLDVDGAIAAAMLRRIAAGDLDGGWIERFFDRVVDGAASAQLDEGARRPQDDRRAIGGAR